MATTTFVNFVCIYFATILLILPVIGPVLAGDGEAHPAHEALAPIQHITGQDLTSRLLKEHKHILLYVYETACSECLHDLLTVQAIQDEAAETIPELAGLKAFASFLPEQMMQFGISGHPVLIFFREGVPVPYEGVSQSKRLQAQDVILWLLTAKSTTTILLNDDNFEHDTQASTGATTGDWFVMFYDSSCDKLLPRWETLAVSLKGKKPVGRVDKASSPNLVQRLNIQKCPELILFRQGKMHYYELPKDDTKTLESFALSVYQNAKSGPVPKVPSPFDKVVEAAAGFLKKYPVLFGLTSGALLLTLLVILVVTSRPGPHVHED
ncbi:protein disulfide-isomerase A4-like [Lineus longissimus]|uniref:protein disulfide-isomerase A4-like n=1 Tax=Lineus longissimus TaxID=88925 RepID=UPI002B4ED8A2